MKASSTRLTVGNLRELSTIGIVAALSSTYATALFGASNIMGTWAEVEGEEEAIGIALNIVSTVFIAIALFVSALVISGGIETVIAGRVRQLTLLRLIGASGRQLRVSLIRAVAQVSAVGAVAGLAIGTGLVAVARTILERRETIPAGEYAVLPIGAVLAAAAIIGTAVVAAGIGTRRSLGATALRGAKPVAGRVRGIASIVVVVVGGIILVDACHLGEEARQAGLFVAFLGAATVGTGVLLGAPIFLSRLVSVFALAGGSGPAALVARKNAISDPARTARSTVGLLVGVTLVTTIAAGMNALAHSIRNDTVMTAEQIAESERVLSMVSTVLIALIAISAVIAGVGFVSTMSLTVIARTREIGMLRAMGFTGRQVRRMITLESLALSGTAAMVGLVLGLIFGSVGSQSLIGSITPGFSIGLPWQTLLLILLGTFALVLIAALPPSRRAVAVAPTTALATA